MTAPALARTSDRGHRVYAWHGRELPSVTAILDGGIPKPLLVRWAARQAAVYAAGNLDLLATVPQSTAVNLIKAAPWATRDAAADLGTIVHACIQERVTGQPTPIPVAPPEAAATIAGYLAAFDAFCADYAPRWLACEATVFNLTHGYAGTLDLLAEVDGGSPLLLDVKTGNRVYPEVALQLAAYANGEFIGHPDGTVRPLPRLAGDLAGVLHLRPSGRYELVTVDIGPEVFAAFLAARRVFRWATEQAEGVLAASMRGGGR